VCTVGKHIGFSISHSFRYLLGVWNIPSMDKGDNYVAFREKIGTTKQQHSKEVIRQGATASACMTQGTVDSL
jgi:hypothetical protein